MIDVSGVNTYKLEVVIFVQVDVELNAIINNIEVVHVKEVQRSKVAKHVERAQRDGAQVMGQVPGLVFSLLQWLKWTIPGHKTRITVFPEL